VKLYADIETRSHCDLKKAGAYVYAEHPTTQVMMFAYRIGRRGRLRVWIPLLPAATLAVLPNADLVGGPDMPADLRAAILDPATQFVAHNASFERTVLGGDAGRRLLGDELSAILGTLRRWNCTAARAAMMGLPRTLDGAAGALDLSVVKDKDGHKLMLKMCKPRKTKKTAGTYLEDEASIVRLAQYCATDVDVECLIDDELPEMPPAELATWRTTERMNDRGVRVDVALLLALLLLVEAADNEVNGRISAATGEAVPKVSDHGALTRWLVANGLEEAEDTGVGKAALAAMLERKDLDPTIRNVLVMRRDGGGAATKKFNAILQRLSRDGKIRGVLVYCGATATRRWSSRGAQLQNLPRGGSVEDIEAALRDILDGATPAEIEDLHGPALVVAAEALRPLFTA
jgi:DNA polymerase